MKTTMLVMVVMMTVSGVASAKAGNVAIEDRLAIIDVITDIAAGADRHQWDRVRSAFADEVVLDYTSLWGGEPSTLSGDEVVASWSGFLPGFDRTLHLVTNHTIVANEDDRAIAEADFQATHRIGNAMWQLMGHYRYELSRVGGTWKVTSLTMTYTHETGDRGLVEQAGRRQKR
ncbi:nuclear transport factor 2 family protein [Rhizobium sp. CNPSo 4039]|uniref:nuclear transport factor 2 family protein n=1 Tax=Rhizobium sp. CNPSo 4039 TaxID=3021409 RepID=UPI00254ED902|nr:nuclear transport factor 2 family protein [Rhizobium sp. CNPSo 4039]MDK4717297.1 nuclear transport factor 2 family protein [Rhizobium sp. CNPSo 4039]